MIHHDQDALDSASMRVEIVCQVAFHEILVEDAAGREKWFDAKQSGQVAGFIKTCTLPVRIKLSYYRPVSGMTFKYRSNNRRPSLVPGGMPIQVMFFEGVPKDKKERRDAACKLLDAGLKPTIVSRLFSAPTSVVYSWRRNRKKRETTCKPATVAVHCCA